MSRLGLARRLLLVLVVVVLVFALAAGIYGTNFVRKSFPQVDGTLAVAGLSAPVTVSRDDRGIPTIVADTPMDLFRAQGYVHAQDRFFEMDLRRHVTAGRLAELVGEDGLESDKVIRTMGWRRVAEQELGQLSSATRQYLQAYADGVNAYLEGKAEDEVAVEYAILGQRLPDYRIEKWTPVDSLAWIKAMAWDLRSDYTDELRRARIFGRVSADQIRDLYPPFPAEQNPPILAPGQWPATAGRTTPTGNSRRATPSGAPPRIDRAYAATIRALDAIPDLIGAGENVGSNSWVVSGARSSTGKPLLANDTHLGVAIPGVWYQATLRCRQVDADCPFDVSGFSFSGVPGIVIGHNDTIAWSYTNLAPDVTDFYLEQVDGVSYLRDGEQEPLTIRTETLNVAGGDPVSLTVRETVHGPILSDVIESLASAGDNAPVDGRADQAAYAVSLAWTALRPGKTMDALFAIDQARSFEDFREAARDFAVPSQNLLYADTAGHIGYQAPGMIPIRELSADGAQTGLLPAKGWESEWDWKEFVPFEQLPWVLDPPSGYLVAANQAVTTSDTPFLTSEWDPGFRAKRIGDLITATPKLTVADMARIQGDTRNEFAPQLVKALLAIKVNDAFVAEAQDLLRDWDFTNPIGANRESAAAAYYNAVWSSIVTLTFNDELPPDVAASGGSTSMQSVAVLLGKPKSLWWDDRKTAGVVETRDEILRQALVTARDDLTRKLGKNPQKWDWGQLHEVTLRHKVLGGEGVPGFVRWLVNAGPYAVPGGSGIVNAFGWDASAGYASNWAPAMRMIVDLADFDDSAWSGQTGQSGHPRHAHYRDQIEDWRAARTRPWPFSAAAVEEAGTDVLTLTPGTSS
ncbi:MAG: penicillin acylase family protein [Tetrasphaera sp.]